MTIKLITAMIDTFENDPPSNEFQLGYLQALIDLRAQLLGTN